MSLISSAYSSEMEDSPRPEKLAGSAEKPAGSCRLLLKLARIDVTCADLNFPLTFLSTFVIVEVVSLCAFA